MKEAFLREKLEERKTAGAFRQLRLPVAAIDFCSNDYLGLARSLPAIGGANGSTGSRLLSGHTREAAELETFLAAFHDAEAALVFNSGYDANLSLLSSLPARGDTVLYDQLAHASIRDGIRLGFGKGISFLHNDVADLEKKLQTQGQGRCFVVTESVFSMDGDMAPLAEIAAVCDRYNAHLLVDEAHGFGVLGERGEGLVQSLGLASACLARVYTYGKAAGVHGACIAGSVVLKDFLVNFARPFIFTTAPPPHALLAIGQAYTAVAAAGTQRAHLQELIQYFREALIPLRKLDSVTAIQGVVVPGNEAVKQLAARLQEAGYDVRPILYPTVPKGSERLRIVLHAYNTMEELEGLVRLLQSVPEADHQQ